MKIAGIVAEFNPFHNGHALIMKKTREAGFTHIVVAMSGNYTQRGEAASFQKSARAAAALQCGADLIIELPLPWAVSSAEKFASGAISILDSLNCVDSLVFGSESGDISLLQKCAELISELDGSPLLYEKLRLGYSFPKAVSLAIGGETALLLENPNDTLGIEYIKSLNKLGSTIQPICVKRVGAAHDAPEIRSTASASASALRVLISKGCYDEAYASMPKAAAEIFSSEFVAKSGPISTIKTEALILSQIRRMNAADFKRLPDVSEGLENRIWRAAQDACSLEELLAKIKTKRYTMARIRRIVLCAFLGVESSLTASSPPYLRVLGFNDKGVDILRLAKKRATLPIYMRHADFNQASDFARRIYELECRSTDQFELCLPNVLPCGGEQKFETLRINC